MNQLPAFLDLQSFSLDLAAPSSSEPLEDPTTGFLQKDHGLSDFEAMAFWSRLYDLRGGSLHPYHEEAVLPCMEHKQSSDLQTSQAVEDAVVAERHRLARELHDAVTQTLFAASLIAEVLPDLWEMDQAEARQSTEELRQLTRGALAEMRTLLFELRPTALNQARLPDLLRQLSEAVMGRRGLPIHFHIQGDSEIPCDVKIEIYRIAQESLNNVVKYARATLAEICLRLEPGRVLLEIRDNGLGFDINSVKPGSLGLHIMSERAQAIHASLQILSQPGMGTTIRLDWQED